MDTDEQAKQLLESTIKSFQKFVMLTHENYYKQDSDRALAVGTKLQEFQCKLEKWYNKKGDMI